MRKNYDDEIQKVCDALKWNSDDRVIRKMALEILEAYHFDGKAASKAYCNAAEQANFAYQTASMKVLSGVDDNPLIEKLRAYMEVVAAADRAGTRALDKVMFEQFHKPIFGNEFLRAIS